MSEVRSVGIIGIGPRGSYALEVFIIELVKKKSLSHIHLLLFEASGKYGSGQVYQEDQSSTNWINICERILLLEGREIIEYEGLVIPKFPSYHEWIKKDYSKIPKSEADIYSPRIKIGRYLQERFHSLIIPLLESDIVSTHEERVEDVIIEDKGNISVVTNVNTYHDIDELLLTIGHQPTEPDDQIVKWNNHAEENNQVSLYKSPYPLSQYVNSEKLTAKSQIGIRGFGLAMIDVARGIADNFGDFIIDNNETKSCKYKSGHSLENLFIPFSLDGLPPAPKPLNAQIDEWFKPMDEQVIDFENKIKDVKTQEEASNPEFLINAFAPIAASVYSLLPRTYDDSNLSIDNIKDIILLWMKDNKHAHPHITPIDQSAEQSMEEFVGMAVGSGAVSLDYCIGQVWRHCQPSIYKHLSFNSCSDDVFEEIIALDERIKRYSYGPPVESIQQMLALIKEGVMNINLANDPEIELTDEGWCFNEGGRSITANMMINSVLDSPKIKVVSSPLVKSMLANDLIKAVHDELGVMTDEHGYVVSENKDKSVPIALLGRLAKGTIIGVDAILECYGVRPQKWASAAADNHMAWLSHRVS